MGGPEAIGIENDVEDPCKKDYMKTLPLCPSSLRPKRSRGMITPGEEMLTKEALSSPNEPS